MTHTNPSSEDRQEQHRTDRSRTGGGTAHTDHHTMRRLLRREICGVIGLLTDEHDFRAMRNYRSFAFDDYTVYLAGVEDLLKARASQGMHTVLALFDPEEYADFCADTGLTPDSPSSRTRFTAEIATTGPTLLYNGEPLGELAQVLIDEAVRQATWEYASMLLARLGNCAVCGRDIGQESLARARDLLIRILGTADPGRQHLVCSVSETTQTLTAVLHADSGADGAAQFDDTEALEFTTVLALGLAALPGGLVMRTSAPNARDRVYGWRLRTGDLVPLTAGEVFDAYCTDIDSGDLISPESDVDYCVPPDLGPDGPTSGHHR